VTWLGNLPSDSPRQYHTKQQAGKVDEANANHHGWPLIVRFGMAASLLHWTRDEFGDHASLAPGAPGKAPATDGTKDRGKLLRRRVQVIAAWPEGRWTGSGDRSQLPRFQGLAGEYERPETRNQ
jgi:hypothetical protein